jgi:hypothetical protein
MRRRRWERALTSQLIRYRPAPPLDAFVAWFWWSRRDQPEAGAEHVLPSGSAQMIFALHEAPFTCLPHGSSSDTQVWSRAIVHGPQGRFYRCGSKPAGTFAWTNCGAPAATNCASNYSPPAVEKRSSGCWKAR